ncbi:uncharacterized protein LOC119071083 [Bradysia coprophila]|uniref:uncharacterized protein LOC119071083 n=1 Tax=Bradysia coprophila TaxID=38358 RepID=UPI00187DA3BC|nr:uncharacterized protein LOC119071083 [Bradysia coprophila]
MLASKIENKVKHNFIDYKQPVNAIENDFRTASYLGHRYFKQNDFTIPPSQSIISPRYVFHQKEMRYDYASEHASQYTPKYNFSTTNKARVNMNCSRPTFAKSMERRIFASPPKSIRNGSTQARDYAHRTRTNSDYVILNPMCGELSKYSGVSVDRVDEGCYKYDSTNMSDYKAPHGDHVPPGCNKDTVTVWNYNESFKCRPSKSNQKIVGNRPMFLKHNGMKSEKQSAYVVPVPKRLNCGDQLRC